MREKEKTEEEDEGEGGGIVKGKGKVREKTERRRGLCSTGITTVKITYHVLVGRLVLTFNPLSKISCHTMYCLPSEATRSSRLGREGGKGGGREGGGRGGNGGREGGSQCI